jgi:hypothetical protein
MNHLGCHRTDEAETDRTKRGRQRPETVYPSEEVNAQDRDPVEGDEVGGPGDKSWQYRVDPSARIKRPGIEAAEKRTARPDRGIPKRQVTRPKNLSGQDS